MQVKRFVAADMRRALQQVRDELGEEAMILSTQRSGKGVELLASLALDDTDHPPINKAQHSPASDRPQTLAQTDAQTKMSTCSTTTPVRGLASGKTRQQLSMELENARQRMLAEKRHEHTTQTPLTPLTPLTPENHTNTNTNTNTNSTAADQQLRQLQNEISAMRTLFTEQLADLATAQAQYYQTQQSFSEVLPAISDIKQRLGHLGLTQACNDQIIRDLKSVDSASMNTETLWHESLARLARKLPILTKDLTCHGGCFALLGPTGVGKTTTIAKLAARYVIANGPEKVALLTTDTYRTAAHKQLQSLAAIMKIPLQRVDDVQQLPAQLQALKNHELILIDTPGINHNDADFKKHLQVLGHCPDVNTLLVLSLTSQFQMLQASLHRYRLANLQACVLTKLDECANLGDAISFLASNHLPLSYISDGQAVPDDLAVIKPHQLLAKAVALQKTAPIQQVQ